MLKLRMNVPEKLWCEVGRMSKELIIEAVNYCANKYKFSAEEAIRDLCLEEIKVERKVKDVRLSKSKSMSMSKKCEFPLPYNGEYNDECCQALRQNNGLYTQCQGVRRGETEFCKSCASSMQKSGMEVPEYGTIKMRNAVGIFEYVDPKGRKPVSYTKVMNKYKLTKEQVLAEAKKLNMEINEQHFVVPEETKRGRPSKEKEPKEKCPRGRPKKSKKVVEIDNECEDLFASLVANANEDVKSEEEEIIKKNDVSEEEKEAKKAAEKAEKEAKKAAEKAEKEAKMAAQKAEKEAKLAAEKAEKEAKKAAEKAEKEAKKKAEEEEKAAKKLAAEQAKAEKEAKLAAEKAAKEAEKAAKEAAKKEKAPKKEKEAAKKEKEEEEEEPDVVKKIEFEGKKYLKSKKTGIIYDYNEYTKNGEQVVVGKWNDTSNKIEFTDSEEEEDEEDYEM